LNLLHHWRHQLSTAGSSLDDVWEPPSSCWVEPRHLARARARNLVWLLRLIHCWCHPSGRLLRGCVRFSRRGLVSRALCSVVFSRHRWSVTSGEQAGLRGEVLASHGSREPSDLRSRRSCRVWRRLLETRFLLPACPVADGGQGGFCANLRLWVMVEEPC
jgi:hypothetical protein